jgi:hypothetical protein
MLELTNILRDIDTLGRERAESVVGLRDELGTADSVISKIASNLEAAVSRIESAKTSWLISSFDEEPGRVYDLPSLPAKHGVIAVDGSQIVPDKNEVVLCYLINTSRITIYYGTGDRPSAKIVPKLCFRDDEMFEECNNRKIPVTEKHVGIRRTTAEGEQMEYAIQHAVPGVPIVALWDGSLIRWSLENEPTDYKKRILENYLRLFDVARERGIPVAGYISDPGSRDFVNSMRIMLCDRPSVNCDACEPRREGEPVPCDKIARLTDSTVFRRRLEGGKRSVLFSSSSKILDDYGEHRISAFYLDSGRETVRIEVPEWVAKNPEMLDMVHAVCFDQASKGRGYPIALSEAHEHAVVRGPERSMFYQAIERSFVKHGAKVSYSMKRRSKNY